MIDLAYPWLLAVLPLPFLVRWLVAPHRASRPAIQVPFLERLATVSGVQAGSGSTVYRRSRAQWLLLVLAWICLGAALAKPQRIEAPIVREEPMRDLLLALDLSGSMETEDFTATDGSPLSRLEAARQVLKEFLGRRDGDRVGLVLFGSAAFVQMPFTDDLAVVEELLDETEVRMLGPRTALGDAMGLALSLFERSEVSERVLIVLTDGNDTGSLVPPERAAAIAADRGVTVHAVAMGDPQTVGEQALDAVTLQAVARTTGGEYFHASDREELERIYRVLDELNPRQVETRSFRPRTELYPWPLGAALSLSLLALLPVALRRSHAAGAPS